MKRSTALILAFAFAGCNESTPPSEDGGTTGGSSTDDGRDEDDDAETGDDDADMTTGVDPTTTGPDPTTTDPDTSTGPNSDTSTGPDTTGSESCADEPCAADATCEDTADGFVCTCNDGYTGDGLVCDDVDECDGGSPCDPNATCTNEPGSYDCECNDGFAGDGFSCQGTAGYGESCDAGETCASGLCILDPYFQCSELCSQDVPNDCPNVGASGFCVPISDDDFGCVGTLDTGLDSDDEILQSGDAVQRNMNTLDDADLFHLETLVAGDYLITVTPSAGVDVQLDVRNSIGQLIGSLDDAGEGGVEAAILTTFAVSTTFAVVSNAGVTTGTYTISIEPSP